MVALLLFGLHLVYQQRQSTQVGLDQTAGVGRLDANDSGMS
jgi:hypothetical protein